MAFKQFVIDEMPITIYKRKTSRSLKLSVAADGKVQVSIPSWAAYSVGLQFAVSRKQWIKLHMPVASRILEEGQPIGKAHRLHFVPINSLTKPVTRVQQTSIVVQYPSSLTPEHSSIQQLAAKACVRALRVQAELLLPQRLQVLAEKHSFTYQSVRVKVLKSRWGSCDQEQNIVLNLYLMQLPWECIDYVLVHELMHTRVMHHGPLFWRAMNDALPNTPALRYAMREHKPMLKTLSDQLAAVA